MAKFRKKPVIVEAEQFNGEQVKGMCIDPKCWIHEQNVDATFSKHVHTIHQNQPVSVVKGDWILPEPDGIHFYPCKSDIFEATYEPVEETQEAAKAV